MASSSSHSCSICLEEFETEKSNININIATTKCGHTFHASCVFKAARQKSNCPLCRQPLFDLPELGDLPELSDLPELGDLPELIDSPEDNQNPNINEQVLLEFMTAFPNEAIMNEIHRVYGKHFSLPAINELPYGKIDEISREIQMSTTAMLLYTLEELEEINNLLE